ncbi:SRPBCC family protein [Tahibacter amnicola]|uniref:SRPBCC family protein n=1 Tax=Tahibacter amnicola TaxID=2976241 RepID=A0ABY6BH90_9GAMM|nr:SRPBCC family protein [Tahibacter amnicola]UXI69379.1 SRPBCC family protein [Tahibacter amnicola]
MRSLMRFLTGVLLLVLVAVAAAFLLPDRARVEREITVRRPPSQLYVLLSSFRRFNEWSPWYARDPSASYVLSGPDAGVGAKLSWTSERRDVGSGSQVIRALEPGRAIDIALELGDDIRPAVRFVLEPDGPDTRVRWTFDLDLPLTVDARFPRQVVGRYMGLVMDRMVGADYETGLARLKALAEQFPAVDIAGVDPVIVDLAGKKVIYMSVTSAAEEPAPTQARAAAFETLRRFADQHRLVAGTPPMTVTLSFDGSRWEFEAAVPAQWDVMPSDTPIRGKTTPSGPGVQWHYRGAREALPAAADKLHAWIAVKGLTPRDNTMMEYLDAAEVVGADAPTTLITVPVE